MVTAVELLRVEPVDVAHARGEISCRNPTFEDIILQDLTPLSGRHLLSFQDVGDLDIGAEGLTGEFEEMEVREFHHASSRLLKESLPEGTEIFPRLSSTRLFRSCRLTLHGPWRCYVNGEYIAFNKKHS